MTAPGLIDLDHLMAMHTERGLLLVTADREQCFYLENPADETPMPTGPAGLAFVTELLRLARLGQHAEGGGA